VYTIGLLASPWAGGGGGGAFAIVLRWSSAVLWGAAFWQSGAVEQAIKHGPFAHQPTGCRICETL